MIKCPVETCMWSNKKGGCLYKEDKTPEELAKDKNITPVELKSILRKSKSEISRFIVLEGYIEFIKKQVDLKPPDKSLVFKINRSKKLDTLLRLSKLYTILKTEFSLSNFIIACLVNKDFYLEYAKTLGIKPPNLVALTGYRETCQEQILLRVSKLSTRKGNKNRRNKKKRQGTRK